MFAEEAKRVESTAKAGAEAATKGAEKAGGPGNEKVSFFKSDAWIKIVGSVPSVCDG